MSSKINLQTCEYACKSSVFQDNQLIYSKYEISYLFKERGKGVKLNERLIFNHFFNSGAGSASSVYPLVEAQAQRNR